MLFLITVLLQLPLAFAICEKPAVRREWRALSKPERAEWIRAVNCLANTPSEGKLVQYFKPNDISKYDPSGSYYDDFVFMHMDLNHLIHFTGMFLPFHRWFVQVYENTLKEKCGFTGVSPYWDWSLDAHDFYGSSMFKDPDPKSGLGGWGDPSNDFQVPDGGFSSSQLTYPSFHTVRRNFTLQPFGIFPRELADPARYANTSFTPQEVSKLVNGFVGDYKGFQTYLEATEGVHSSVHLIVGADLAGNCPGNAPSDCVNGPTFSPNGEYVARFEHIAFDSRLVCVEPMFWMHHAMIDKIWLSWQQANKVNARTFEGGSVQVPLENLTQYPTGLPPNLTLKSTIHGEGIFPDAIVQDVLSTTDGMLCYMYE